MTLVLNQGVVFSFTFDTISTVIIRAGPRAGSGSGECPETSNYDFQFWIPSKRGWSRFVRRRYRSVRSWIRGFVFRVVDFTPIDRASLASRRSLRFGLTRGRGIFFENHPSVSRQKSNRIGLLLIVCPPGERRKVWGRGVYRRVR